MKQLLKFLQRLLLWLELFLFGLCALGLVFLVCLVQGFCALFDYLLDLTEQRVMTRSYSSQ